MDLNGDRTGPNAHNATGRTPDTPQTADGRRALTVTQLVEAANRSNCRNWLARDAIVQWLAESGAGHVDRDGTVTIDHELAGHLRFLAPD